MPLATQLATAKAVIHKLEQPHRFNYVVNFADGHQHNELGSIDDVTNYAKQRLIRLGVDPTKVNNHITICDEDFTTGGGLTYDMVHTAHNAHREAKKKVAEAMEAQKNAEIAKKIQAPQITEDQLRPGTNPAK